MCRAMPNAPKIGLDGLYVNKLGTYNPVQILFDLLAGTVHVYFLSIIISRFIEFRNPRLKSW